MVTEVDPDSAAAEAGLRPGDVIQEINRKPVRNAEEAVRMTEEAEDKTTLLRVWRDGGSRYVVVDESEERTKAGYSRPHRSPLARGSHSGAGGLFA